MLRSDRRRISEQVDPPEQSVPKPVSIQGSIPGQTATMGLYYTPPGASVAMSTAGFSLGFPWVIGALPGDSWWEAAQEYRSWGLRANATWLSAGPLTERVDVPQWAQAPGQEQGGGAAVDFWLNANHKPATMQKRLPELRRKLGLSGLLGVHWYNWGEYPMDTHFPVYGSFQQGLREAVKTLQAAGVKCLPYTNARVFSLNETRTNGWDSGASQWSLKAMPTPMFQRRDSLSNGLPHYIEMYDGLSGTHYAPMCPYTKYWQNRTAATGARLVGEAGMDGVYLDQVAEAAPERCFDPTHGHPIGGGSHWESGYTSLLREVWKRSAAAAIERSPLRSAATKTDPPLVAVESNAEAEMSAVGAYLTWLAFGAYDPHYTAQGFFVNMFAAANGGYFAGFGGTFGHDWEVLDYFPNASMAKASSGNADGLAAKLAWQTLSGVAMGWANDGVPDDAATLYNGSGTVDWLVRAEGNRERDWLQRLAALRRGAGSYLVHGHRARDLLPHDGRAANRTFGPIRVPSLQAQAWIGSYTGQHGRGNCSMAVVAAAVRADPDGAEELRFTIRPADLAAVFGESYATQGVVMERVHGSWEREDFFQKSVLHNSSGQNTVVGRVGASEALQYHERLGPRELRFFRICTAIQWNRG